MHIKMTHRQTPPFKEAGGLRVCGAERDTRADSLIETDRRP